MSRRTIVLFGATIVALALALRCVLAGPAPPAGIQVYAAKNIITMNPEQPSAEVVAVREGRILAVGTLEEVLERIGAEAHTVDDRFAGRVLMPGFIDPHIHPSLAGAILPMEIVSAMAWTTPRGRSVAVRGREAFLARLRELEAGRADPGEWLMVWGYHAPYHGRLARADLDAISRTRPIMVWQRSVHEMYFNSAALAALELEEADFAAVQQSDWETGHVYEAGLFELARPMIQLIASPGTYRHGLSMMTDVLHRGGLTTVGEQGFPQSARSPSTRCCGWRCTPRHALPLRPGAERVIPAAARRQRRGRAPARTQLARSFDAQHPGRQARQVLRRRCDLQPAHADDRALPRRPPRRVDDVARPATRRCSRRSGTTAGTYTST